MDHPAVQRRYALALFLVPDPDAAGDLFMDAASTADLHLRANRWRLRRGLTPVGALPPEDQLPSLTAEEGAYALHLNWRAGVRRRVRLGLGIAGVGALLLALLWLWQPWRGDLTADPIFDERPLSRSESVEGLQLSVYRAEASAGSIVIWWALTGPGLSETAVQPDLILAGTGSEWRRPIQTEVARDRHDRLVGQSTFSVVVGASERAVVHLSRLGDRSVDLLVRAPLTRVEHPPGARTLAYDLHKQLGGHSFTLEQVVLASTYTLIRYQSTAPAGEEPLRHLIALETSAGRFLEPIGPPLSRGGTVTVIFRPVPAGVKALTLHVRQATLAPGLPSLAGESELRSLTREGSTVTAQLSIPTYLWDRHWATPLPWLDWPWLMEGAHFVDPSGQRYEAWSVYQGEDPSRHLYLWRLQAQVPPAISLEDLQVWITRLRPESGLQFGISW